MNELQMNARLGAIEAILGILIAQHSKDIDSMHSALVSAYADAAKDTPEKAMAVERAVAAMDSVFAVARSMRNGKQGPSQASQESPR